MGNSENPDSTTLRVIEGVYNGEHMQGVDGKIYPIPPNYASKSKLVEGDRMKLYLQKDGSFIYKQTLPVERKKMIGVITPNMQVLAEEKTFSILIASITYFKARPGDQAVIIIPLNGHSTWAAMENIIRNNDIDTELNET